MRSKCELFSNVCGIEIRCNYPKKERCGFQFYTNKEGESLGLCRYRVDQFGFKKTWREMEILVGWKKEVESK